MYVLTFVLWLILNARLTWEVAGMGLVLTALFGVFFGCFLDYRPRNELRAWRRFFLMLGYVGLLIREVIKSNLAMIDIVWDKSVPVAPTLQLHHPHTRHHHRLCGRQPLHGALSQPQHDRGH